MVGAPLEGRVLIIDDVITAGTAIREVMEIVDQAGAEAAGVVIGLDRKEKGKSELSAIQEVEKQFSIPVKYYGSEGSNFFIYIEHEIFEKDFIRAQIDYATKTLVMEEIEC